MVCMKAFAMTLLYSNHPLLSPRLFRKDSRIPQLVIIPFVSFDVCLALHPTQSDDEEFAGTDFPFY